MPEYLKKRGSIYYVRVPVPKQLWATIGKRDIVRTTGTGDLKEAKRKRHAVIAKIQQEIETAMDNDPASVSWLERQAAGLRASVKRGELDSQLASDIIGTLTEKHLKARGQSTEGIQEGRQLARIQSLTRSSFDVDFKPLSELITQYLSEKSDLRASTIASKKRHLDMFSEWLGEEDPDINTITRKMTSQFVSDVLIPRDSSPKTKKDTVTVLSTFFNWAIRKAAYEPANPFTGLAQDLNGSTRGSSQMRKRHWINPELVHLFDTIPSAGKYYLREMSACALFTGARLNEIAELKVTDIDLDDQVIHIREGKNQSAVRITPIHKKLLPVLTKLVGKRTSGYLFDTLKATGADKIRGHEPSKRFGYFRNKAFPDTVHELPNGRRYSEVDFHSFRRSLITACEDAGIPEPTTQQLVGHGRAGMSYGTYSKGVKMELLREELNKVNFDGVSL